MTSYPSCPDTRRFVLAVLLFSALLRFAPIFWGTPAADPAIWNLHPDEEKTSKYVHDFPDYFAHGDPFWHKYPNFLKNPMGMVVVATRPVLESLGIFHLATTLFFCRLVYCALGIMSVILAYLFVARLLGRMAGLSAVLLLNTSYLHVLNSAVATPDVPTSFFVILSMYLLLRAVELERECGPGAMFLLVLTASVAFFVKFTMAILVLVPAAVAVRCLWLSGNRIRYVAGAAGAAISGLVLGVLVLNPESWLDTRALLGSILFLSGQHGVTSLFWKLMSASVHAAPDEPLLSAAGPIQFVGALAGAVANLMEKNSILLVGTSIAGLILVFCSRNNFVLKVAGAVAFVYVLIIFKDYKSRYLIAVAPVLAILGAVALERAVEAFRGRRFPARQCMMAILVLMQIYPVYLVYMKYAADTRYRVSGFVSERVSSGETIAAVWLDGRMREDIARRTWPKMSSRVPAGSGSPTSDWIILSSDMGARDRGAPVEGSAAGGDRINDVYNIHETHLGFVQRLARSGDYELVESIYPTRLPMEFVGPAYWIYKRKS